MTETDKVNRTIIDRDGLPFLWPTHRHTSDFWEQLGRTVASFGFLEEVLGKAIFAFTATRRYDPENAQVAYDAWLPKLQKALADTLKPLADDYAKAVRDNPDKTIEDLADLISAIKDAADVRNVICHGSWRTPDTNGKSLPLFVDKKGIKNVRSFDARELFLVQCEVVELACSVIDTVTHMGFQFPGGAGPGKRIWNPD